MLGFWVTCGVEMMWLRHGWGWHPPQTASHIHITHITCLSTLICCPLAYSSSLTQFYPPYLDQILRFWVTCGVNTMWLCHGWGWGSPQTDFHIYITHIQIVWAHWYAVHWHTVRALHSYTIPILLGSYFEVLLCHLWSQNDVIMSWLRLAATSNCFPHPYYTYTKCLSTLICCSLAYSYSNSLTQLYHSFWGVMGHLWSQHDVNTLWLRLRVTSNCFPHPH